MAHPNACPDPSGPAGPVWANLTAERRRRVVRLLAQLAYDSLFGSPQHSTQETTHASSTPGRQASFRTS